VSVPSGTAPAGLEQSQQSVVSAEQTLAADQRAFAQAQASLDADLQKVAIDCRGGNAAETGGSGGRLLPLERRLRTRRRFRPAASHRSRRRCHRGSRSRPSAGLRRATPAPAQMHAGRRPASAAPIPPTAATARGRPARSRSAQTPSRHRHSRALRSPASAAIDPAALPSSARWPPRCRRTRSRPATRLRTDPRPPRSLRREAAVPRPLPQVSAWSSRDGARVSPAQPPPAFAVNAPPLKGRSF